MNISQIDLNLLVVFQALSAERNTVRAGEALGLSQPAVSHALGRLRVVLGDRLFVRGARGLIPTPRALELEPAVKKILAEAEQVLLRPPPFDPRTSRKTIRIATTEYFEQVVFPALFAELGRRAPFVSVISRSTLGKLPKGELEAGDLDLAIAGFFKNVPERFFQQKMFDDDFVAVARAGLIPGKSAISLERYAKCRHILISPQGDMQSKARELLEKNGHEIHYALGTASFLSPARILAASDLLLTCPRKLANSYRGSSPLEIRELSFKIPAISLVQVWHERNQDDPAHRWFRELLREICSKLDS
jgi:DNA-binding transcriptional LysR family regulator